MSASHDAAQSGDIVDRLAALFASRGADAYLGEPVTMSAHMLQAAALARDEAADESVVAAALLHDVGHLLDGAGEHHDAVGAALLADGLPPVVAACAALHVAAKRFLCATEPDYAARLSAESVRTLALQGGPMTAAEVAAFRATPFHAEAVRVRRWDEAAKVPEAVVEGFDSYLPLLRRLQARPSERP